MKMLVEFHWITEHEFFFYGFVQWCQMATDNNVIVKMLYVNKFPIFNFIISLTSK